MIFESYQGDIVRLGLFSMYEFGIKLKQLCFAILLGIGLMGCASVPTDPESRAVYEETNDPAEPFNRAMWDFNVALDDAIIGPLAKSYRDGVPEYVRERIHNFLNYLRLPIVFASKVLQGEPEAATETVGRFLVNTIGLGFNDIATDFGIAEHDADFGTVLATYGVDEGPYLVLPLLGPYNTRHAVGAVAERFVDPVAQWTAQDGNFGWAVAHMGLYVLDWRASNYDRIQQLRETSLDYYATVRSAYRQSRRNLINGVEESDDTSATEAAADEDIFEDFDDLDDLD